jgi:hypothetical protein
MEIDFLENLDMVHITLLVVPSEPITKAQVAAALHIARAIQALARNPLVRGELATAPVKKLIKGLFRYQVERCALYLATV